MSFGFKEWAVVCEALGDGRQCLILRKGGIAEGRDGFAFKHPEFLLFPTWFHEQLEKTRLPAGAALPEQNEEVVEIRFAASVVWSKWVEDREKLRRLEAFHILHDSVVDERFAYDDAQGLHVAFVRIFRLDPPHRFRNEKRYGGCRSWVELPEPVGSAMVSIQSDETLAALDQQIRQILE